MKTSEEEDGMMPPLTRCSASAPRRSSASLVLAADGGLERAGSGLDAPG